MRHCNSLSSLIALLSLGLTPITAGALPGTVNAAAGERYAWSGNTGWIDFAVGGTGAFRFEDYFLCGHAWSPNIGWIHFGDGVPANGVRYGNQSAGDCGVNHDGRGNLSGYAYGANIGWINFQWTGTFDQQRPRVNLLTGQFHGYAYGANIGWINLAGLRTATMGIRDSDGDGLSDPWECEIFGGIHFSDGSGNLDSDSRSDREEFVADTDPGDSRSVFSILSAVYESDLAGASVTFQSSPRRLYRLEISATLEASDWSDCGLGLIAPSAGDSTTRWISWTGTSRKFIRAVAVLPLSAE